MKENFAAKLAILLLTAAVSLSAADISSEWTVFGPYYRLMHRLPDELVKNIPEKLKIGRQTTPARKANPENGKLDIAALMGKKIPFRAFYVCIPIQSAKGEKMKIGAGADWWMDIYLNGKPVGDTMMNGNVVWPPSGSDFVYDLTLKPGKNLLVIGMIGGGGSQQLCFQANPKEGAKVKAKMIFGKEKLPALSSVGENWKNGSGKAKFLPKELSVKNGMLVLSPKMKAGERRYIAAKLHLEPGKQYCLNWSAWTSSGKPPVMLIQEKENGGVVYYAKELSNGRNRNGYFFAENPEPWAILEMRGTGNVELPTVSLKRRIDRSALFQDWRIQRFPAPYGLDHVSGKTVTEHFDFASALPGGSLKVFTITPYWMQRLRVELEQRFDFKTDGMFTNGNAGVPPEYWTRDKNGLAVRKNSALDIQRALKSDCILIDSVGASGLTKPMVQTILKAVKQGTGLVVSAFDQPFYPYKDGRGKAATEKLRKLFSDALAQAETTDTDYVKIAAAGTVKAQFGSYGKGRIVFIESADNVKGYDRFPFEVRAALFGKAVCWASNRVPEVRLNGLQEKDGGLVFTPAGSLSGKVRAEIQFADQECRILKKTEIQVKDGTNSVPSGISEVGQYPTVAVLSRDGKTLDWDLMLIDKAGQKTLKNLKISKQAPIIKGSVEMSRKAVKGETLEVLLKDNAGSVWKRFKQPAKGKIWFSIPTDGIAAVGGTLTVQLKAPDGKVLDQLSAQAVILDKDDPDNLNFCLGMWGFPINNYPAWLYCDALRRDYNLDFMLTGNTVSQAWAGMKKNIRSGPSGAPGSLYFGQNNKIKGGDHAPERVLCLSSDELKNRLKKTIKLISTPLTNIHAKYYFMDHETNLLGYINKAKPGSDYCFSPTCRASLRELVKADYGTLEKLNTVWGTSFAKWEDVTPIVLADAIKTARAPRWIDHRRNMDKVWTDLTKFRIGELRKYDPGARGYIVNLHSAYSSNDSFSGIDYEQLMACEVGAGSMPESYINAFILPGNRTLNAQGGSMWPPSGGAVDDVQQNSVRSVRVIWQSILMGQGCCLYYLHNFQNHGVLLYNDIFMYYPDLTISPEGKALADGLKRIRQGTDRLLLSASKADDSGIAMLYSRASEHACTFWQAMNKKDKLAKILNPRAQQFEFFAPAIEESFRAYSSTASRLIKAGGLDDKELLILPFAQSISTEDAEAIRKFVRNGGTVLADFRPAVTDQHGAFGKAGLLDDVFGIRQELDWKFAMHNGPAALNVDGIKANFKKATFGDKIAVTTAKAFGTAGKEKTPVFLENRFGKGRAVLLNFTTSEPSFRKFFGAWLGKIGIPELFKAEIKDRYWLAERGKVRTAEIQADKEQETTGDKTATEDAGERETLIYENSSRPKLYRFTSGPAEIIGYFACRRGFTMGKGELKMQFTVRNPGHVYDLIRSKYLGKTDSWEMILPIEDVAICAVLPFEAQAPKLSQPAVKTGNGGALELRFRIDLRKEAADVRYPVRITLKNPSGKDLQEYARTVTVDKAAAKVMILLPSDAPNGKWQITAREVFAGKTDSVAFTLDPEKR